MEIIIKSKEEIKRENIIRLNRDMANAAKFGRTTQVQKLLQLGADANFVSPCNFGYTPLHHAAREGHVDTVLVLLKYGANTEARDKVENRTPLHYATTRRKTECIKVLLDKGGAFVDTRDKHNNTPLHHAVIYNETEAVKALMERGADKNLKNDKEQTPIDIAVNNGHDDCADILLRWPMLKDGRKQKKRKK